MLFRLSLSYFSARAIPLFIAAITVPIYTHIFSPQEYGYYAKVMALVMFIDAALFQWVRLSILRYLESSSEEQKRQLAEIYFIGWGPSTAIIAIVAVCVGIFRPEAFSIIAWLFAITLLYSWHQFSLIYTVGIQAPLAYAKLATTKAIISLGVGALLAQFGMGGEAALAGVLLGCIIAPLFFATAIWRHVRPKWPEWKHVQPLLKYGLPLVPTFLLAWIVQSSDRLMLAWMLGDAAVGQYTVGYTLAQFSMETLLVAVNLAAYPLAIQAMEKHGEVAAQDQIRRNGELLFALAGSVVVTLFVFAKPIAAILVGDSFSEATQQLLPIVALAAAIAGLKAYHLDVAFHLSKNPQGLVISMFAGAIINVTLNIIWIPIMGFVGAAWATVGGYAVAAYVSYLLGKHCFNMPTIWPLLFKAILVALTVGMSMLLANWFLPNHYIMQLLVGAFLGSLAGISAVYGLNIAEIRLKLSEVNSIADP